MINILIVRFRANIRGSVKSFCVDENRIATIGTDDKLNLYDKGTGELLSTKKIDDMNSYATPKLALMKENLFVYVYKFTMYTIKNNLITKESEKDGVDNYWIWNSCLVKKNFKKIVLIILFYFFFLVIIKKVLQKTGEIEITDLENKNSVPKKFNIKLKNNPKVWIDGKESMFVLNSSEEYCKAYIYNLNEAVLVKKISMKNISFPDSNSIFYSCFNNSIIFGNGGIVTEVDILPEKNEIVIFSYPTIKLNSDQVNSFFFNIFLFLFIHKGTLHHMRF